MLTLEVFEYGLDLLHQNYDRQLTEPIKQIWLSYLDENLNDDEFIEAVKRSILHSRFMPTAGELVDYIHGGKEIKALQEWGLIVDAAGRSDVEERLVYISDRARIALKAIGGVQAVGWANSIDRQRLEKKFVSVFCQCSSEDRKALAQSAQEYSEAPSDALHDEEEQERNRRERQRRWEQKNNRSELTSGL